MNLSIVVTRTIRITERDSGSAKHRQIGLVFSWINNCENRYRSHGQPRKNYYIRLTLTANHIDVYASSAKRVRYDSICRRNHQGKTSRDHLNIGLPYVRGEHHERSKNAELKNAIETVRVSIIQSVRKKIMSNISHHAVLTFFIR